MHVNFCKINLFQVYGDQDADGFYWGECRGRRGFVPNNMVEEVKDPHQLSQLQGQPNRRGQMSGDRWGDDYSSTSVKKMIALYDYEPQEQSPNVDAEVRIENYIFLNCEKEDHFTTLIEFLTFSKWN